MAKQWYLMLELAQSQRKMKMSVLKIPIHIVESHTNTTLHE